MEAFIYGIGLQWKLDLRNKGVLMTYYVVPLVFFCFMGGMFTSINPEAYKTLIQSMTIFGVTMGAFLGTPAPLVELYGSEMKKAYAVGGIPLWTAALNNFISAFLHLMIMSTVILFVAPIAFHATIPEHPGAYLITLMLFVAASLCVGTTLGLFVKGATKLTMIAQFIFLPSIMVSGIMFPASMLPKMLQNAGKVLPATWGYILICSNNFQFQNMLPLLLIMVVTLLVCIQRLSKMKID